MLARAPANMLTASDSSDLPVTRIVMTAIALAAWLAVNALTMLRFWQDKRRAQAGRRRIAEAELLQLAMIGGSPAALLARRLFRHKTRKEPFSTRLLVIAAAQLGVVGVVALT